MGRAGESTKEAEAPPEKAKGENDVMGAQGRSKTLRVILERSALEGLKQCRLVKQGEQLSTPLCCHHWSPECPKWDPESKEALVRKLEGVGFPWRKDIESQKMEEGVRE